ncbi:helix-turn-helix domain-containing protein [Pseudomonas sp. DWRC2-2]|uniref:helix-turn-helix domain-containing protein n=1 Tax=Pseudomonas sp. DWRC2-2 TaxID=2804567 RepID=UPI003CEE84C7
MSDKEATFKVGAKIKHTRQLQARSLKEVALKAEVTEGYLSKIENGIASPSLPILHRVVAALGINMGDLFANPDFQGKVHVIRAGERPILKTGHRRSSNNVELENLVPSGPGYLLQVNIHVVPAKGGSNESISHLGQEFGLLLEGELELLVEDEVHSLATGDSFFFNSAQGHRYRNVSDKTSRILWVNTPATF